MNGWREELAFPTKIAHRLRSKTLYLYTRTDVDKLPCSITTSEKLQLALLKRPFVVSLNFLPTDFVPVALIT